MSRHINSSNKRKSRYNPNRSCYLTADGKYYCYEVYDPESKRMIIQKLEIGKDGLTAEWTILLDEMDHEEDLNERYALEHRDTLFDRKNDGHAENSEDDPDPWNTLADERSAPERVFFSEEGSVANRRAEQVRQIIDNDCTDAQRDLFFNHFGLCRQISEIRQEEAERTGKLPTAQAMNNRKNKLLDKVAKSLGAERVKRRGSKDD